MFIKLLEGLKEQSLDWPLDRAPRHHRTHQSGAMIHATIRRMGKQEATTGIRAFKNISPQQGSMDLDLGLEAGFQELEC